MDLALGPDDHRQLFDRLIISWARANPLLRVTQLGLDSQHINQVLVKVRAYATDPPTSITIEARLNSLEKNVTLIHRRIAETQNEIDREFQKAGESLKCDS
jgi:hypothetical protein